MRIVLDIETTYTILENKRKNPSPYLSTNRLVSVGIVDIDTKEQHYFVLAHKEVQGQQIEEKKQLQALLNKATLVVGHNLKFDIAWLLECGYSCNAELYDTMIAEYVFAKGQKIPLSLAASCERYALSSKLDILTSYFAKGYNTDEIPLSELIEYGIQDCLSTKELYEKHQSLMALNTDCAYMSKAVKLMNSTLPVLIDIERNGIYIDTAALEVVEKEYRLEYNSIKARLQEIITHVMGHTPVNLESPEHLSQVLYSRKVKDKKQWKEMFNLGTEIRNSVVKTKHSRYMPKTLFTKLVKEHTSVVYRTIASQCECCKGTGKIQKIKKDGSNFKNMTCCPECDSVGYKYEATDKVAGFRILPLNAEYAATGGFSTDKVTIMELLKDEKLKPVVREFLTGLLRLNSIATYLTTFVEGIKKNVKNNILHTSFNQCLTATGRLSSSNPNFQNLPRGKTFPVRRVITSRFENGQVFSVDFKQLEFRVAAILANDKQAEADILNNVDIHIFTRDTITAAGQPMDRQDAKIRTFKPLYGGIKGTEAEEAYYKAFLLKYKGIDEWQKSLENEALSTGQIKSPSGRIYSFPQVRRMPNGSVLGHTQIKNYIVQGFATGDITPVALIEIWHRLVSSNMKSKIVLTVHDDITLDVHPDEVEQVVTMVQRVFKNMNNFVEGWFGIQTKIPIEGDFSIGINWLDKKELLAA